MDVICIWGVVIVLICSNVIWDGCSHVPVELLADDVWAAEDNKTGFLIVGVDNFDRLYL